VSISGAIPIETLIIHLRPTNSVVLQSRYCRQAGLSTANLWNSLPAHLTSAPSLAVFRQRLKTFLFPDLIIWHSELSFSVVDPAVTLVFRPR